MGMDGWAGGPRAALAGLGREQGLGSREELLEGHSVGLGLVGGRKRIKSESPEGLSLPGDRQHRPPYPDAHGDGAGLLCSHGFRVSWPRPMGAPPRRQRCPRLKGDPGSSPGEAVSALWD